MSDLIEFYALSIFICILLTLPLVRVGSEICARDQFLEIIPLTSLVTICFHLLALFNIWSDLPLFAIALGLVLMGTLQKFMPREPLGALVLTLLLIALDQALLKSFPILEAHNSTALFADLVTLNGPWPLFFAFSSLGIFAHHTLQRQQITLRTFEWSVLERRSPSFWQELSFNASVLFALFNLGPLHTLALLSLPSFILAPKARGYGLYQVVVAGAFILSPFLAVASSLSFPRVPTLSLTLFFLVAILYGLRQYFQYRDAKNEESICGKVFRS